jgi:protein-arginine kinase
MISFHVNIQDELARKVLQAYLDKLTDLKDELKEIDKFIKSKIQEHFDKEMGSQGELVTYH